MVSMSFQPYSGDLSPEFTETPHLRKQLKGGYFKVPLSQLPSTLHIIKSKDFGLAMQKSVFAIWTVCS